MSDHAGQPETAAVAKSRRRVLHSVGHLARGGVETWLYEIVRRLGPDRFEHHALVWTDEPEAFTAEFRDAGVWVHAMPDYKNPVSFARNFRRLLRSQGPFDILHTHGTHFHGFVMLLAKSHGIAVRLAHSHTDIRPVLAHAGRGYRAYAAAGHRAIRMLATGGFGVSEAAAASMFGPFWRSDPRWDILHCGIDLAPFAEAPDPSLRQALGIPAGRFVVGHVGRFEPQKNHGFILDIAAELARRGQDAHFLLIGDGSMRAAFEAMLERQGLASRFTILPDCRTVPRHMTSAMDRFILPSLYEGLPLVAVEAQAAGLPCLIATGVSGEAALDRVLTRRLALDAGAPAWTEALLELPERTFTLDTDLRARFARSSFNIERSASRLARSYGIAACRGRDERTPY